jgi:hypothetical protein
MKEKSANSTVRDVNGKIVFLNAVKRFLDDKNELPTFEPENDSEASLMNAIYQHSGSDNMAPTSAYLIPTPSEEAKSDENKEEHSEEKLTTALSENLTNGSDGDFTPILPNVVASNQGIPKLEFADPATRQLYWYKNEDLLNRYRVSQHFVLEHTLHWLFLTVLSWGIYINIFGIEGVFTPPLFFGPLFANSLFPEGTLQGIVFYLARGSLLIFLFMVIYWELYRRSIELRISGFRLIHTRGIIWKTRVSMAVIPVMQIFIEQSFFDLLFDHYRIRIWLPGNAQTDTFIIPSLCREHAFDLQNFLSAELSRQVFIAGQAVEVEDQIRINNSIESTAKFE